MEKTIDFQEWVEKYQPEGETDSGGTFTPTDIGYDDPRIKTMHLHIWTRLSIDCNCDGPDEESVGQEAYDAFWDGHAEVCPSYQEPDIFNGARLVNRMEYYFCKRAFDPREMIGVS